MADRYNDNMQIQQLEDELSSPRPVVRLGSFTAE